MAKVVETKKDLPFIVVSPQTPTRGWNPEALDALLDRIILDYRVDRDRVYLTGLSMGRLWDLGAGGRPSRAVRGHRPDLRRRQPQGRFQDQGSADLGLPTEPRTRPSPLARSQEMVDALKAVGSDVKFTVYPDAVHDSWTETYDNPELYTWFLSHKRGGAKP